MRRWRSVNVSRYLVTVFSHTLFSTIFFTFDTTMSESVTSSDLLRWEFCLVAKMMIYHQRRVSVNLQYSTSQPTNTRQLPPVEVDVGTATQADPNVSTQRLQDLEAAYNVRPPPNLLLSSEVSSELIRLLTLTASSNRLSLLQSPLGPQKHLTHSCHLLRVLV